MNSSLFIFRHRWGDSTLQATAVRLFMSPSAVQQLPNITYRHMSHSSKLVSSVPHLAASPEIPQVFTDYYLKDGQRVRGDWTTDPSLTALSLVIKAKQNPHQQQPPSQGSGGGKGDKGDRGQLRAGKKPSR